MNINRSSMASYGYAPPTRVFEAAGAGACLLCDEWPGVEQCFEPGKEILVMRSAEDVVEALTRYDDVARRRIGIAFRERALRDHTYAQRARDIESALQHCLSKKALPAALTAPQEASVTGDLA